MSQKNSLTQSKGASNLDFFLDYLTASGAIDACSGI